MCLVLLLVICVWSRGCSNVDRRTPLYNNDDMYNNDDNDSNNNNNNNSKRNNNNNNSSSNNCNNDNNMFGCRSPHALGCLFDIPINVYIYIYIYFYLFIYLFIYTYTHVCMYLFMYVVPVAYRQAFAENRFLPSAPVDFRRKAEPVPRTQVLSYF